VFEVVNVLSHNEPVLPSHRNDPSKWVWRRQKPPVLFTSACLYF